MYQQPELVHTGRKSIQSLSKFIIKHTVAQSSSTCIEEPGGRKTMQHAAKSSKQHVQARLAVSLRFTIWAQDFCFLHCSQAVLRYSASLWICAAIHLGCPFSWCTRVSCCRRDVYSIDCPFVVWLLVYYLGNINGQEEECPHEDGLLAPLAWF